MFITMNNGYYTLPLRPDKLMKGEPQEQCSLDTSITQYVHLIITTAFGEMQQDESFGCGIWDTDFDNLVANNKIRERIKTSVYHSVTGYEKRLQQVKVEVFVKEEELPARINGRQVKKRLDIQLTAVNRLTNEPFVFRDSFYTGPLSYY
ncbi:MAG: GPW/gp25 family protein [Dinghuibacter sp.]|nr:GPW/gp25 family protein [Dinghuibacter sp.]